MSNSIGNRVQTWQLELETKWMTFSMWKKNACAFHFCWYSRKKKAEKVVFSTTLLIQKKRGEYVLVQQMRAETFLVLFGNSIISNVKILKTNLPLKEAFQPITVCDYAKNRMRPSKVLNARDAASSKSAIRIHFRFSRNYVKSTMRHVRRFSL